MKTRAIQVLVIAVLVGLAFWFNNRSRLPDTPEAVATSLFDAAGRGDDETYLRLTAGQLRASLENTRSQMGAAAFRESLRRSVVGIKGVAVSRSGDAPSGFLGLDVDLVFADRNERQRMLVAQQGNGWAAASLSAANFVKPPVAYGSPVYEETSKAAPAGPPASAK